MRDANRIDPLPDQIRDVWKQQPHMRFGQIMAVMACLENPCPELLHLEDDQLAHRIADYRASIEGGQFKLRYVRRRWDESRGDQNDNWGPSWWYFEIDVLNNVLRQIEDYDNGPTNGYDSKHEVDEMGGLSNQPLDNVTQDYEEISADLFDTIWSHCSNRT